jgi:hypothetical protein
MQLVDPSTSPFKPDGVLQNVIPLALPPTADYQRRYLNYGIEISCVHTDMALTEIVLPLAVVK